jgi:hypothetical protein
MTISMKTMVLAVVLAFGAAMPLAAQELTLAYQFQRISVDEGLNMPMGFNVDAAVPFGTGNMSVFGQFDWSRKSESDEELDISGSTTLSTFGGGIRWSAMTTSQATPFLDVLFGVVRNTEKCEIGGVDFCEGDSGTNALLQFGGGVAVPINAECSFVGQADYRRIFTEGAGTNTFRFVAGVRIRL